MTQRAKTVPAGLRSFPNAKIYVNADELSAAELQGIPHCGCDLPLETFVRRPLHLELIGKNNEEWSFALRDTILFYPTLKTSNEPKPGRST